jgi:dTDP-4-dehydrorhamnose 3,5-epimerase-like enzyme
MVSPDYSATVAMHLAHAWSTKGEIIPIIPVDVPYPTETYEQYQQKLLAQQTEIRPYQQLILVEAGIIRGGNWAWILDTLKMWNYHRGDITLVALCENVGSKTKSDYVGEYYDDNTHELMFYFERFNKHWAVR